MNVTRAGREVTVNPNSVAVGKIPVLTQSFIKNMNEKTDTYRIAVGSLAIDVFPHVFPPESPFSTSSSAVYMNFGDLKGKTVLDMGTGTGILAIEAVLAGAKFVHAVDISPDAVACAKHNVALNHMEDSIHVDRCYMFDRVYPLFFDLVVANLPIVDAHSTGMAELSLIDPDFSAHKALFETVGDYLNPEGRIVLCHADLQENGFKRLEEVAIDNNFLPRVMRETFALGHVWRSYEFSAVDWTVMEEAIGSEMQRRKSIGIRD